MTLWRAATAWVGVLLVTSCAVVRAQEVTYRHQSFSTAEGLPQNSVHAIAQTPEGFIWAATEAGLVRLDGVQVQVTDRTSSPAFVSDDLCCLLVDDKGTLWVGSRAGATVLRGSVFEAVPAGRAPAALTRPAGRSSTEMEWARQRPELAGQTVLCALKDREGNIWVGTETSGLHLFSPQPFHDVAALRGVAVTAVVERGGRLVVGTRDQGVLEVVGESRKRLWPRSGAMTTILSLAVGADGTVYAGTGQGLVAIAEDGGVRVVTSGDGLPDDTVNVVVVEADGDVWVSTAHGLARRRGGAWKSFTRSEGLPDDYVGAMLTDERHHRVLAATGGGVCLLTDEVVNTCVRTMRDGTLLPEIVAMAVDPRGGYLLASADAHLMTMTAGGLVSAVTTLPMLRGRPLQPVSLTVTAGALWVQTNEGVLRARLGSLTTGVSADTVFARYGTSDGMSSAETVPGVGASPGVTQEHELVFPTRSGVAVVASAVTERVALETVVEAIHLDDRQQVLSGSLIVPVGVSRISFDFAAPYFAAPAGVRYRYRLSGFDKDWVDAGTRRTATYTSLPARKYVFEVEAALFGQEWPKGVAQVALEVTPPVWRRWWFVLLCAAAVAALLWLAYLVRLRVLRGSYERTMRERNRLAREIHDTLAQDFVSTTLQLDIVAMQLRHGDQAGAVEHVHRARQILADGLTEARQSIAELRDAVVAMDLRSRLERLIARESFRSLHAALEVEGDAVELRTGVAREVVRIVSEALTNAVRHARATRVTVRLRYAEGVVLVIVEDDGVGFALDTLAGLSGHYGVQGMLERAATIGAQLTMDSAHGRGTTVRLEIPVSSRRKEEDTQ